MVENADSLNSSAALALSVGGKGQRAGSRRTGAFMVPCTQDSLQALSVQKGSRSSALWDSDLQLACTPCLSSAGQGQSLASSI